MTLNDKVQVGKTTAGTGTSTTTTTSQWQTYNNYKAEQGWECPRCGRINAPWVRQCDCSRSNWTITCDDLVYKTYKPEWWKEVTCHDDSVMNNPTTYTTAYNNVVGGSDYPDGHGGYTNVTKNYTNKVK